MAVKHSSSGGTSAMKASLVLMLLFGAVVAAHGKHVSVHNLVGKPIVVGGTTVEVGATVKVDLLDAILEFGVIDKLGQLVTGLVEIPVVVTAVVVVYEHGYIKIKVATAGLLSFLLNLVLGLFRVALF